MAGTRTWIIPEEGWIYHQDRDTGLFTRTSLARWQEDRRRAQRAAMIETGRSTLARHHDPTVRYFNGDQRLRHHRNTATRSWYTLSARPGRLWRLSGRSPWPRFWAHPLVALGFEGVTLELARVVGPHLAHVGPKQVEDVSLPAGDSSLVVRRRVKSVRPLSTGIPVPGIPTREIAALEEREQEWQSFTTLWGFFENPSTLPPELDRRDVRERLEAVVRPRHVVTIRERIRFSEDLVELEELFLLLDAVAPELFATWLADARSARDLPTLLSAASALSLRRPEEALELIHDLLGDAELLEGLDSGDRDETRSWLRGVRDWLEIAPRSELTRKRQ